MQNYEAVSEELHKNKYWKHVSDFRFASHDALCSLVIQEAPKAALHLPIAFSKAGDHFGLFAVQGLETGTNYLVDSAGNWQGDYIPMVYRHYPFALASSEDKQVLCIDRESGLINEKEGHTFFDEEVNPSHHIKEKLDLLSQFSANQNATKKLCAMLEEANLLEPWPISVKNEDKEIKVNGLFRVNEVKFNTLEANSLKELRDNGALPLIFCQLLSMQNLARLLRWGQPSGLISKMPDELSLDFQNDGGNINFEGL